LNTLLMAKYSDILGDGERSPSNFWEQTLRLGGEPSLNLFATINNRFSFDQRAFDVHAALEQGFLNDSTKSRLARMRRKHPEDPSMIVFTRFGALILLKILLASGQKQRTPKSTVFGACAMHANDYAETDLDDLSNGLLPVVAETAATWELQNPRDVGVLLRRTNYIYRDLLLADTRISALVERKLGCPLTDVKFAGLSYDQYFAVLFGLYATVKAGVLKQNTSIVDIEDLRRRAGFSSSEFEQFLREKSDTIDGFAKRIGQLADARQFSLSVMSPKWCSDVGIFRRRPLLRLADGRFLVLDMQFLIENASAGLYWSLASQFSDEDRLLLLSYWGGLFESYVQRLLFHYAGVCCASHVDLKTCEVDSIVVAGNDLLSSKSSQDSFGKTLRGAVIGRRSPQNFARNTFQTKMVTQRA
jgi:hypothetical protein